MTESKFYTIVLDGIDKTGKDLIAKYIWELDNSVHVVVRGWPSMQAYARIYERSINYALPQKDALYVHLLADCDDWRIRCKLTDEPAIDYALHNFRFDEAFTTLVSNDYYTFTINSSTFSPIKCAKLILETFYKCKTIYETEAKNNDA